MDDARNMAIKMQDNNNNNNNSNSNNSNNNNNNKQWWRLLELKSLDSTAILAG